MILDGILDEPGRLGRGKPLLGLTLKLGIAHEEGQQQGCARGDVLAGRLSDAAIADKFTIPFDPSHQRAAQPGIVGPAFGCRNRVAIGMAEAILLLFRPRHRPFDAAAFRKVNTPEEWPRRQHHPLVEARREEVAEPARKVQPGLDWNSLGTRESRIASPANLKAAEQVRLGPCHAVERRRAKSDAAENLGIGVES